jgi:lysozyme
MTNEEIATEMLKIDEGCMLMPYTCTAGALSIGFGRNLSANGISEAEALILLKHDVGTATRDAKRFLSKECWEQLTAEHQAVVINLAFNLGLSRLRTFVKFRACLLAGDMDGAAAELLDSQYAQQVGARADRLASRLRS